MNMASSITLVVLLALFLTLQCSSSISSSLRRGLSHSVDSPEDLLISPNGTFSAGFVAIGENAYSFAIWFTEPHFHSPNTVTWIANRDQPVNGKHSKFSLSHSGNIVLVDADLNTSYAPTELHLKDDGNLVLVELQGTILWQSFDFPTDTLLPGQHLTRYTQLVSSRSQSNHSSGFYKLLFDDENVLSLHYDGPDVASSYWPKPWLLSWDVGRTYFSIVRRLKLDCDGNVRVYGRNGVLGKWYISWEAMTNGCLVHGICGANSICAYHPTRGGRKCSCLPGYRLKNHSDWWSYGCEPVFNHLSCKRNESSFLEMKGVEVYGYDMLKCYTKTQLLNGRRSPKFTGSTFLRLPKGNNFSDKESSFDISCDHVCSVQMQRDYTKPHASRFVEVFLWFAIALGAFEMVCILVVWCFLIRTNQNSNADQKGYHLTATGFRKFSYSELKRATKGFSQEIGRGAGGVVYKGVLSDQRHAAIKRLYNAKQGEGEFLAEVGIIGRLNHMNLIEMWGYCAEGQHRILVYEYMENGSLAQSLSSNTLDWSKRNNLNNLSISMIRGTRGYMAPEWVFNLPITSKVDVYSYGIVVLEMVTGKSPTSVKTIDGEETYDGRLVAWVREKRSNTLWVEQIIEPAIGQNYDKCKMEILTRVALDCVGEDKDSRPTMSQVVDLLQCHGTESTDP
ncbi:hypothetical protein RJT34_15828 [Clitoria ternatea]|uniref:non-specific serine/threonine protein kinase n=1 Tax=Clitoria ternatea TaxID=43366 RepID=A0AAN9PD55_CLITE